jgi:hypothetical protein
MFRILLFSAEFGEPLVRQKLKFLNNSIYESDSFRSGLRYFIIGKPNKERCPFCNIIVKFIFHVMPPIKIGRAFPKNRLFSEKSRLYFLFHSKMFLPKLFCLSSHKIYRILLFAGGIGMYSLIGTARQNGLVPLEYPRTLSGCPPPPAELQDSFAHLHDWDQFVLPSPNPR